MLSLFPNLVPDEVEREIEKGVTVYEIEGLDGDDEVSVEISESGEILELESELGFSTVPGLPETVQAALSQSAAGGLILEYKKKSSGDHQVYQFEGLLDEKELELAIASDGTVLSVDFEAKEDDDDHDDDDGTEEDYEEEVSVDELPEAILASINSTYPNFHLSASKVCLSLNRFG